MHAIEILEKSRVSYKTGRVLKLSTSFNPTKIFSELEKFFSRNQGKEF
jgi:hypothetical protein